MTNTNPNIIQKLQIYQDHDGSIFFADEECVSLCELEGKTVISIHEMDFEELQIWYKRNNEEPK